MSVRNKLLILILSIFLPTALGAVYAVRHLQAEEVRKASETLMDLVHAMADSVDRELAVRDAFLRALATSPALDRGDLRTFYGHAKAAAPSFERTIVLSAPSGQQMLNTRLEYGAVLPQRTALQELRAREGLGAHDTLVSDVYFAPIGKQHSFAVQVPVVREGRVLYYLSMGSFTSTMQRLLDDQRLGRGWNAAVIDRQGVLLARRIRPEEFVGKPATKEFLAHRAKAASGVFETVRLDGERVYTAFTPIGRSGWTLAVSMPTAELSARSGTLIKGASAFAGLLLLIALLAASLLARSITRSVSELVHMAKALGRGEQVTAAAVTTRELRLVADELEAAGAKLRAANETLEQRVQEAVSEARRAQEALLHHQKLEALGRLTGGIAHDFNNILQTLSVSLEIASRLTVVDGVRSAVASGKRAVERGTQLTRQLLSFARTSSSATATIDPGDYIRQQTELVRGALRENIELRLQLDDNLWPTTLDPVQLDLALLNIAVNARDAMPAGGVFEVIAHNVSVHASQVGHLAPGDYVAITLRDTGSGIPAAALPHIFEPFFTTKEAGKGAGLGLAQVYGFATQLGGTVTVASRPGEGTAFTLYLPRSNEALSADRPTGGGAQAHSALPAARVLFVDDDPLIRRTMSAALHSAGFSVYTARNGEEALRLMESQAIDVCLTDVVMPGMSGVELGRQARARFPEVRVILATGYSEEAMPDASFQLLRKPYDIDAAVAAIGRELASSQS